MVEGFAVTIEIVSIVERPDLVALAAAWQWEQWGRKNGAPIGAVEAFIAAHTAVSGVPQCFVLLDDGVPAAVATLEAHDLDARPDLSPWLANLVVDPAFRGRGHAIRLVRHTEAVCRAAGLKRLYLNTESAKDLYARLGWLEIGTAPHFDHIVTIMVRELT